MNTETTVGEVRFSFGTTEQFNTFVKWFKSEGFNNLILSKKNIVNPKGKQEQISCLSTDEKMDWGYYFELE